MTDTMIGWKEAGVVVYWGVVKKDEGREWARIVGEDCALVEEIEAVKIIELAVVLR